MQRKIYLFIFGTGSFGNMHCVFFLVLLFFSLHFVTVVLEIRILTKKVAHTDTEIRLYSFFFLSQFRHSTARIEWCITLRQF